MIRKHLATTVLARLDAKYTPILSPCLETAAVVFSASYFLPELNHLSIYETHARTYVIEVVDVYISLRTISRSGISDDRHILRQFFP